MTGWTRVVGAVALAWLAGCRCGAEPPVTAMPPASHFGSFDQLVSATVRGDVEGARWLAASLQEGDAPAPPDDGGGAQAVGGALGFLQLAEDADELAEGVAAAAVGCGACHAAAGVPRPELGPWEHESGALRMTLGAVFPPLEPPADTGGELRAARAAWDAAAVEPDRDPAPARLAAALASCSGCHAAGAPVR